jgi:DNA-binding response OmpR family regulator
VDDDEMMRQLEVMIVQDSGLLTLEAASAAEARAHLEEHGKNIGLVLLDVHLPDGSGVQLCEAITGGAWPDARSVPIIIVTADREEAIVEDAFFAGSVRQFHKPFEPDELQAVVRSHRQSI